MNATERLALPLIQPGQAQKELFHNEALQLLDSIVAGAVEEPPRNSPPTAPVAGSCYIVGANPAGEWAGHAGQVAAYTAAGWRYQPALEGMVLHVRSSADTATFVDGAWELGVVRGTELVLGGSKVVGSRAQAITDPAGGAQIDAEARSAIAAILAALRGHGLIES